MTWQSGSCDLPMGGVGAAFIVTDDEPEVVRVADADVRRDKSERVRVTLDESVGFPSVERGLHQ